MTADNTWHRHAVIYQIYPRSFADSSGDGIGDLQGIISKLDYLAELKIDAIWLSPIYPSPMADFGYDVSDYKNIDPTFGNLEDFDNLLQQAHARGIKVLMDMIPNHTSSQHSWFRESRSYADNPKRDWYIWKDPLPDGAPPNNWQTAFGGSAWTLDALTNQYYLHSFLSEQPDLNWDNPAVRMAFQDIMRFWYNRGVDGFRVDAILFMSKDLEFKDETDTSARQPSNMLEKEFETAFAHKVGAKLPAYLSALTAVTAEYPGAFLFLEAYPDNAGPTGYAKLYDLADINLAAPFYFGFLGAFDEHSAKQFNFVVNDFLSALPDGAAPVYALGNHDMMRMATRFGQAGSRLATVAMMTLPGTRFIYNGDELGMTNGPIPQGIMADKVQADRYKFRTPMAWSPEAHGGFTTGDPWIPLSDNYKHRNVETMSVDPHSTLKLYRRLAWLREEHPALATGTHRPIEINHPDVCGFERQLGDSRIVVLLNFSSKTSDIRTSYDEGVVLCSSTMDYTDAHVKLRHVSLRPDEALIINVS